MRLFEKHRNGAPRFAELRRDPGRVLSSFVGRESAWRGLVGVLFIVIAGYWLLARDKSPDASE